VKGLSGCSGALFEKNSKSDLVQRPVVLELEKGLICFIDVGGSCIGEGPSREAAAVPRRVDQISMHPYVIACI
jgi:hypothetical protein